MKNKNISFTSWICPILKTNVITGGDFVYSEGDEIKLIFFNPNSEVFYVLPKYMNTRYVKINQGNEFGLVDLLLSVYKKKNGKDGSKTESLITLENWNENNNLAMLKR